MDNTKLLQDFLNEKKSKQVTSSKLTLPYSKEPGKHVDKDDFKNSEHSTYLVPYIYQHEKFSSELKYLEIEAKTFLNKSVIFYGPSKTGKTVLIKWALWQSRHIYPLVIAHVPTNQLKHDYDKIIAPGFVHEEIDLEFLSDMYTRQLNATETYNRVNNINTLKKLLSYIDNSNDAYQYLEKLSKLHKKAIDRATTHGFANDSETVEEINENYKEEKLKVYKTFIKAYKKTLMKCNLSEEEKFVILYITFNPRLLFINDDATAELNKLIKEDSKTKKNSNKNESVIKNLFYKGRHAEITHWYAFHNIKDVNPDLRNNSFWNVFTDKQLAIKYFGNPTNSFSPQERKEAEAVINQVFGGTGMSKYAKLMHNRETGKFYYTIAQIIDEDFKMGCDIVKTIENKSKKDSSQMNKKNPFYQKIKDQLK